MRSIKGWSCFAKPADNVSISVNHKRKPITKNVILTITYSANEGLVLHRTNASGQLTMKIVKALLSEDYSDEL